MKKPGTDENHEALRGVWEELLRRESLQTLCRYAADLSDDAIKKLTEVVRMMKKSDRA